MKKPRFDTVNAPISELPQRAAMSGPLIFSDPFKCTVAQPYTAEVVKAGVKMILHPEARPISEQIPDYPNGDKSIRCPICGYSWEK